LGTGTLTIGFFLGIAVFALAARWREEFGILGVCSFLTGLFYGWVWLLERSSLRAFQEAYGDLGIYPLDHVPRGWHSLVLDFQPHVLLVIWVVGLLLFLRKLIFE